VNVIRVESTDGNDLLCFDDRHLGRASHSSREVLVGVTTVDTQTFEQSASPKGSSKGRELAEAYRKIQFPYSSAFHTLIKA
jgi:hypothetical protein